MKTGDPFSLLLPQTVSVQSEKKFYLVLGNKNDYILHINKYLLTYIPYPTFQLSNYP